MASTSLRSPTWSCCSTAFRSASSRLDDHQLAGGDDFRDVPGGRREAGRRLGQISGTIQNDILKEFIAQKEYIFPPRPSMRLVTDVFSSRRTGPAVESDFDQRVSHPRGRIDALQELAFTLRDGLEYVDWASTRGLGIDDFAPRLSFFFNAHSDFFEEIAKYRAARKIWAYVMRDRFGAKTRVLELRFHAQTAGCR